MKRRAARNGNRGWEAGACEFNLENSDFSVLRARSRKSALGKLRLVWERSLSRGAVPAAPEERREEGAEGVEGEVERVGGAPGLGDRCGWQEGFEEPTPDEKGDEDLAEVRGIVVAAQAQDAGENQKDGEPDGDAEQVVEVVVEEGEGEMRLEEVAVEEVGGDAEEKEGIEEVAEAGRGIVRG